jgi:DNA invertase Pin-like site-specific DNA recombinase
MAAVAELEAGLIAERTKEALAAAKKAGKKLGGWNVGSEKARREAQEFADKMRQVMAELAAHSAHQAAAELNKRGVKSATGGQWYPQTILRLRERLA